MGNTPEPSPTTQPVKKSIGTPGGGFRVTNEEKEPETIQKPAKTGDSGGGSN